MTTVPMTAVQLKIEGMTCAACATRIERKLNRLDGVQASVNFALATAHVVFPAGLSVDDLIGTVEATGYRAQPAKPDNVGATDQSTGGVRLAVSAALSIPVVALSMISGLHFTGWEWVAFALATPVILGCAWPFHRAALVNLRHGATTMDTLVSLGALVSYLASAVGLVTGGHLYLEVGAALTTFLLAGRYFEARARRRAGSALRTLLTLGAKDVALLDEDGRERRVPVGQLRVGDLFVVRPGEKIATDGVVVEGSSAVDASLVTGESVPVEVGPGTPVVGACVNAGGRLVVRASRVGADTQLAQLARLVGEAQSGKAEVQRLADRISAVFVPTVLLVSLLTGLGWLVAGEGAGAALTAAVAVLIVACPCALGLATPTALLVGTGRGAQLGIVIRGPQVLESTRRVDTVLLDKTGTVTTGVMTVRAVTGDPSTLRLAAAVEDAAEHPIARAVVAAARDAGLDRPPVTDFAALPGLGARGVVEGETVLVGRVSLLASHGVVVPASDPAAGTVIAVAAGGRFLGTVTVADPVKPGAARAVARLRALGLTPILLTGDSATVARAVAAEVGIAEVIAEVLPVGKVETVRRLQAEGRVVAMVGDGVNDAAALAAADLGISMGTGADVAIEASDLTVVRGDLALAADAVTLSRATLATIKGNLFWAFAYNVAAIPLAAAGLVTPMLAAGAMALSSLFVVSNSLRLFRFRPSR